ncbi:MAG: TIGR00269 family protein [Thermoplasmataceae archaeon]
MKCTICGRDAVYEARYSGELLCAEHFTASVDRRIRREIREQVSFSGHHITISVAVSGGKDSSVTLFALAGIFGGRKNVTLKAFTVDEGIEGYRSSGLEKARRLSELLGVPHSTITFRDHFGTTMDRVVSDNPDAIPCSRCGPMRRQMMNVESLSLDSDYVALGMNLDDYSQSILMNVARGDVDRLARMAPHTNSRDGMVRRILPLRRIPEKEVMLYAILKGIDFDASWCPYYGKAQRNTFREVVDSLEERFPGTRFALLNFLDRIRPSIKFSSDSDIGKCAVCGQPSSSSICPVCASSSENLNKISRGI